MAIHLADKSKGIVALLHSYGGVVGTDALHGLSLQEMTSHGAHGGVRRLLYMSAFIPQEGQSLAGIFGGGLASLARTRGTLFLIHVLNQS